MNVPLADILNGQGTVAVNRILSSFGSDCGEIVDGLLDLVIIAAGKQQSEREE